MQKVNERMYKVNERMYKQRRDENDRRRTNKTDNIKITGLEGENF